MADAKTDALKTAMQLEKDGYDMYARAAEKAAHPLAKKMFLSLAEDETRHLKMIEKIARGVGLADALKEARPGTPTERVKAIFAEVEGEIEERIAASADDLEVLKVGMTLERKSNKFYKQAAKDAAGDDEKALFERLAAEEAEHYKILENLNDYLADSGWWFLWEQGAFMDGF